MARVLVLFLGIATVGSTLYHLAQKRLPGGSNPMVVLVGAYLVALAASAAAAPFFGATSARPWTAQLFSWPGALLGLGAFLIEVGFLLAYRAGGSLQWSGVAVNAAATVVLVPLALLVFGERFSLTRAAGIGLCLAGLLLISR